MRLLGTDTKAQFRQRLEAEGTWPRFIAAREKLKAEGVTGWNAWLRAAEGFTPKAADGEELERRSRPTVDMLFIIGPAEGPKVRQLVAACEQCNFPCVVLLGWAGFDKSTIAGKGFPGVTPADPASEPAARDFYGKLLELTAAGWIE